MQTRSSTQYPKTRRTNKKIKASLHTRYCAQTLRLKFYRTTQRKGRPRSTKYTRSKDKRQAVDTFNDSEWMVHKILDYRTTESGREYLISWEGFTEEANQWIPEDDIDPQLVIEFLAALLENCHQNDRDDENVGQG